MKTPTFAYEKGLLARGKSFIVGVDEVGTGALAGPVVAAAVMLPLASRIGALRDSKLLTSKARERIRAMLETCGAVIGTGVTSLAEIQTMNIRAAGLLAMRRAVEALPKQPDALLVDAFRIPGLSMEQVPIIRGDRIVKSIAAASVVAKVMRDRMMAELHEEAPEYGFRVHKGYATRAHLAALARLGPSTHHRVNFAPVWRSRRGGLSSGK